MEDICEPEQFDVNQKEKKKSRFQLNHFFNAG